MFKLPKQIYLLATFIVMFAICSPILGYILGVILISQNASSIVTLLLGVLIGVTLYYYLPIIHNYFNYIFNLF